MSKVIIIIQNINLLKKKERETRKEKLQIAKQAVISKHAASEHASRPSEEQNGTISVGQLRQRKFRILSMKIKLKL